MSEWLIQESLKRDKVIDKLRLWIFFLTIALMVVSIALLIVTTRHAAAAQQSDPDRVKCTTAGGPIPLGTERVTVPLKCCPEKSFISNPDHPTDNKGNLICSEEI